MRRISPRLSAASVALLVLSAAAAGAAVRVPGDLGTDGRASVRDIVALRLHLDRATALPDATLPLADLDQDGEVAEADFGREISAVMSRPGAVVPTRMLASPAAGETEVAVTRETILRFRRPLKDDVTPPDAAFVSAVGGVALTARNHLGADLRTLTQFHLLRLPASSRVRVTVDGSSLLDAYGLPVDADGDGVAGGTAVFDFDTLTLTTVPGTSAYGRVFASAPGHDGGAAVDTPLQGVGITVDGMEGTMHAVTDANGNFTLDPCPAGDFFVHIHGPNATAVGSDAYYPEVGKLWHADAGTATSVGDVYLPLITSGTMQDVSLTQETRVSFPASVTDEFPSFVGTKVVVPPDTPYSDTLERGGQVGIAPVAPDRLPGKLPQDLEFPLVITVQASAGLTNFDQPVPACFPNLPDPMTGQPIPPGEETALWSYNHDAGKWQVVGPMTVSDDGALACTNPGVGILAPGWHGANSGGPGGGPSGPPDPPTDPPPPDPPGPPGGPDGPPPPEPPCPDDPREIRQGIYLCATGNGLKALGCISFSQAAEGCGKLKIIPKFICKQFGKDIKDCVKDGVGDGTGCADHFRKCMDAIGDNGVAGVLPWPEGTVVQGLDSVPPDRSGIIETAEVSAYITALYAHLTQRLALETDIETLLAGRTDEAQLSAAELATLEGLMTTYEGLFDGLAEDQFYARERKALEDYVRMGLEADLIKMSTQRAWFALQQADAPGSFVQRGRTGAGGAMADMMLRPNTRYRLWRLFPESLVASVVTFWSAPPGRFTEIPRGGLDRRIALEPDTDGDGLTVDMEFIVGTSASDADSDDDGLRDGDELRGDDDPLTGRPSVTGIVASVSFPELADAQDVCGDGSIVAVAAGASGVAVFNVFGGMTPARIAQVDTPGSAARVACAGEIASYGTRARRLLAVADGSAGLAIIDITDPPGAFIERQLPLAATASAVTVAAGIAYVGTVEGEVVAVDLDSGAIVGRVRIGAEVRDVAIGASGDGEWLHVLTPTSLVAVDADADLRVTDTVTSPTGGPVNHRLFVGGPIAHAIHGKGMNTFDLSDPSHPVLIAAGLTTAFGWKQIALNGSGLGIAAVSPNQAFDGPHHINIYDVSDPTLTDQFLALLPTPGVARSVIVHDGLAYVADTAQGAAPGALHVMSYLPRESAAACPGPACPTITLQTNFAAGMVEEGKVVRLTALVGDDVQARSVDFFVDSHAIETDAAPVTTDGSYPFQHFFLAPALTPQTQSLHVRARVVDTGGNATWTPDQTLTITLDATPPRVVSVAPFRGALTAGTRVVSARFNEPVATATLDGTSFSVTNLGADGQPGGGDDTVAAGLVTWSAASNMAVLTTDLALPPGAYRAVVAATVEDVAGNALREAYEWTFRVVGGTDSDGDGMSDDYEQAYGLNVASADQNGNGVPDGLEDFDGDGLRNDAEAALLHGVFDGDSDSGATPVNENDNGINDANEDADGDTLSNAAEIAAGTDPLSADTDRDGLSDGDELLGWGSDPADARSVGEPFLHVQAQAFRDVPGGGAVNYRSTPARATPQVIALVQDAAMPGASGFRETVLAGPDVRILLIEYQHDGTRCPDGTLASPEVEAFIQTN